MNRKINEGSTRSDYNVKYGGANGPFEEIYKLCNNEPNQMGENKPVVKSTPGHFKKDEAGWGPIPRAGLNRREYNVKYSKTGDILEESHISPALQESLHDHKVLNELRRNHLIEDKDLDIFFEKEHLN